MNKAHFEFWPSRLPKTLAVPETTLYDNLAISAKKYPEKTALVYYGARYTYSQVLKEVEALAGYLQNVLGVKKGENVLLFMQNAPQFLIGYYAILRAEAVIVPVNPMNTAEEMAFYVEDSAIRAGIIGQELYGRVNELKGRTSLTQIITAAYSDYAGNGDGLGELPEAVREPVQVVDKVIEWKEAIGAGCKPFEYRGDAEDTAILPYTSGTTGQPKGCIHTNRTVQANTVGAFHWMNITADAAALLTLPLFHVTGMVHSMNTPIYAGGTMVMMTRWDRDYAASAIERYGCTHWINISTMLIDFLANPKLAQYDISSLQAIGGGGAPLPEAVGEKLTAITGLEYIEGYGLSETISHTHFNPPDRPKLQCLGIPSFDVDARVIEPSTGKELGPGQDGELIVNGPQVFKGYHNRPDENRNSFIEFDGKVFFRTGDIVRTDEEGYFFIVDRVKRMINAAGFKVWPTEVESMLYKHPAIQQACVVGIPDPRRGETVKAFVILNEEAKGDVTEEEIIEWAKGQMAAYKYPRFIEFRETFPTTSSGKILWRKLQDEERGKSGEVL
ncbi:long-chain fatty acid--CoA ligase [Planococcus lenghuensis]|uniref:Long-chain fatty acid--CoA ligase n=1 Tax=Planococcus lenghuensis TaxID=2213202 RepID=A0A1Q2KVZ3_9BACL|nr:long-chain fatty acid--CoA ligase [Planococcus lenghuensis]AQQ51977.1 long-chain fatty acid--CoA ligase [Planococcus lenghuensis]